MNRTYLGPPKYMNRTCFGLFGGPEEESSEMPGTIALGGIIEALCRQLSWLYFAKSPYYGRFQKADPPKVL